MRCSGLIFINKKENFEPVVFLEKKFLHQRIQKEDVSIDFTATIDIPEDAVKHYGSMVTLR